MDFYILCTRVSCEDKVVVALKKIIEEEGVQQYFGRIMTVKKTVMQLDRNKNKKKIKKNMYPGYVFVEMEMTSETRNLALQPLYAIRFLGQNKDGSVQPISKKELNDLLDSVESTASVLHPEVSFIPGQMVRVVDGPLSNLIGEIESVDFEKKKKQQLKVSLFVFGRETSVEFDVLQVEKIQ